MSAAPFDVGQVIDRLRTRVDKKDLRLVASRADYGSVRNLGDFPAPAAYVLLAKEKGRSTRDGLSIPGEQHAIAQVMDVQFAVVLAVRNYRQLEGEALRDELRDRARLVRNQLLGWTPDVPGGRACQLLGGDLGAYDAAVALWTELYSTQHIIQPEIDP